MVVALIKYLEMLAAFELFLGKTIVFIRHCALNEFPAK